eukprot:404381-Amphidinium_carterae.2
MGVDAVSLPFRQAYFIRRSSESSCSLCLRTTIPLVLGWNVGVCPANRGSGHLCTKASKEIELAGAGNARMRDSRLSAA